MRAINARELTYSTYQYLPILPAIDEAQIKYSVFDALEQGAYTTLPLIVGNNFVEGNLFAYSASFQYKLDPYNNMNASIYDEALLNGILNTTLAKIAKPWYAAASSTC